MDLTEMRTKADKTRYTRLDAFRADLDLIVDNCGASSPLTHNLSPSPLHAAHPRPSPLPSSLAVTFNTKRNMNLHLEGIARRLRDAAEAILVDKAEMLQAMAEISPRHSRGRAKRPRCCRAVPRPQWDHGHSTNTRHP